MPTYDYQCVKCMHTFEVFHTMKERPRIKCPMCSAQAKKVIGTGCGLIFKGSGFYITDYKKNASAGSKTGAPENSAATESRENKAEKVGAKTSSAAETTSSE